MLYSLRAKYNLQSYRIAMTLFFIFAITTACSTAPKMTTINLPKLPHVDSVDFRPPNQSNIKFVSLNGNNSITKNNVTVTINSIENSSTFSTKINDPSNKSDYLVSITPMAVLLEITNNTNHIITLRKTIVRIEDKNQNEYPLINSISASKKMLIDKVDLAYDEHLDKISANLLGALFSPEYEINFKKFVKEFNEAAKIGDVRLPSTKEGYALSTTGETYKETRAPSYLFKLNYDQNLKKIANAKIKAREQILKINEVLGKVITGGVYQPINILPQRTVKITAPFYFGGEVDEIKLLNVGIYDLPTEVDQAGNPTKRDHFVFEMTTSNTTDEENCIINGNEYFAMNPGFTYKVTHSTSFHWNEKDKFEDSCKVEAEVQINGNSLIPVSILRKKKDKKDEKITSYYKKTNKGYVYFGYSKEIDNVNNKPNIILSNADTPSLPSKLTLNKPFSRIFDMAPFGFKDIGKIPIDSFAKKCKQPSEIKLKTSKDFIKVVSYKKLKQRNEDLYLFSKSIYAKNLGEIQESIYILYKNKVFRYLMNKKYNQ